MNSVRSCSLIGASLSQQHGVSPNSSKAELVFPECTHTPSTPTHPKHRYILVPAARAHRLTHRALMWTQTAPLPSSCSCVWLSRLEVHYRECVTVWIPPAARLRLPSSCPWIPLCPVAGNWKYKSIHSSCCYRPPRTHQNMHFPISHQTPRPFGQLPGAP